MTFLGFLAVMSDRDRDDRPVWIVREEIVCVIGGPDEETVDLLTSMSVIYTVRQYPARSIIDYVMTGESGSQYFVDRSERRSVQ